MPLCHFTYKPFCLRAILPTCHFANVPFCLPAILPSAILLTYHLVCGRLAGQKGFGVPVRLLITKKLEVPILNTSLVLVLFLASP